ncbi:MAG: T9SS type A sorting domain-containing protein [Chlorobi bacterium]|nr:T9SS type A sorting domain-containing protein [Chlorobiota bacterium]
MNKFLHLFVSLLITLFFTPIILFSQSNNTQQFPSGLVGHWSFNNPNNLTEAEIGNALILSGSHDAVVGPSDTSGAVRVYLGSYYTVNHGIAPNGGGSLVNSYTIVMDIKIPMTGRWYAFYQTNPSNTNDGDWFISPSGNMGVGATGYTYSILKPGDWYRVAISVYNGVRHDYYIDGKKALTGTPGAVDGRFSLDSKVLFFADENNEDNTLDVADIKVFSRDLSDAEMKDLGGYEHVVETIKSESSPYLQSPTPTSVYVCWAYKGDNPSAEYGLTPSLGNQVTPETITIDGGDLVINWFTAKLENLEPSTIYYYQVKTDSTTSEIYKFRTQPVDNDSTEHIRFAIYGDSRTVPQIFREINDTLKNTALSLYGENIEEDLNLVFDVGDIVTSGGVLSQYIPEYFNPTSSISTSVPFMVSIGNHEGESPHYYKFMKYEDFGGTEGEKYYSFRIGRVLFLGLNSNVQLRNDAQIEWLDQVLAQAQNDDTIEWIFGFLHHPGHSELWPDGNTAYVQNRIIPTLVKYSKVDMLTYGHSHNYERGTALNSGLRLMLSGGAASALDRWEMYSNQQNYPEIQKTFDHYCYSIVDIDVANKFYEVTSYSLGNPQNPLANVVIDHFIRDKKNETPPATPSLTQPGQGSQVEPPFTLIASDFAGTYDIMSSQFQVTTTAGNYDSPVIDIKRDYEDIYGTPQPPDYIPVDLNAGIDLTEYVVNENTFGEVWARVRYRDKNLQWSSWSPEISFQIRDPNSVEKDESVVVNEYQLYSNYPNPFNPTTTIQFDLKETSIVTLRIYNSLGELVAELENGRMSAGRYTRIFDASNLSSGIYFYKLKANNFVDIKKMTLLK